MSEKKYDLIIIGGGPAGYVAAIRAAQLKMKVACVEKRNALGGTCLNVGCIPSKALLDSSEHYHNAKEKFKTHGIEFSEVSVNLEQMMKRKDKVVTQLTQGIAGLFKKNKIDWLNGFGRLIADGKSNIVEVDEGGLKSKHETKNVLIATGSEPIELPFLKFDGKKIVSSTEALALENVPEKMVVVGGGYIGLEMGSVWSRLGSEVTVIEFQDRIVPAMDHQLGQELTKLLKKQGLNFLLGTKVLGAKSSDLRTQLEYETVKDSKKDSIECDVVLVSTGRRPYTDGLGLEDAKVELDEHRRVKIDSHFKTSREGVYAVGDVVAGPMLAHKAEEEGIAAVEIMAGKYGHVNYDAIPGVIYTWPEFAFVGKTEEQLKDENIPYKTGVFPFLANGRAKAMEEVDGKVKILAHEKTDKVLGVHILGPRASDMIAEAVAVMEFGGSAEDIARTCHAHPTLAEVVKEAAMDVDNRRIHL